LEVWEAGKQFSGWVSYRMLLVLHLIVARDYSSILYHLSVPRPDFGVMERRGILEMEELE